MKSALKVGLTGGVGSGKTTASNFFLDLGVPVIDADEISHALTRLGAPAYAPVVALMGPGVVADNGELQRDVIRQRVFDDTGLRSALEGVIHPLVRAEIVHRAAGIDYPYCIVSIPLLVEAGMEGIVDRVLVIDLPEDQQLSRAMKRDGLSAADIRNVIRAQIPRGKRIQAADDVIDNAPGLEHLRSEVGRMHAEYLDLARSRIASTR